MKKQTRQFKKKVLTLTIAAGLCASAAAAEVQVDYLYNLSRFTGPVTNMWVELSADKSKDEIYLADTKERAIHIFNDKGMEIYTIGQEQNLGSFYDLSVDENGDIYILTRDTAIPKLVRCNFRGERVGEIELSGLPEEFADFSPRRVSYHEDHLYLAAPGTMQIVVADRDGRVIRHFDVAAHFDDYDEEEMLELSIEGFDVDRDGNILFTIPLEFTAYRLSPEGEVERFGQRGGGPGKFGIIADIGADNQGYIYVADRLRCVVLVFDRNLVFQKEFGYRGLAPGRLIGPNQLALDSQNRIYVSQLRERGVSVFEVRHN